MSSTTEIVVSPRMQEAINSVNRCSVIHGTIKCAHVAQWIGYNPCNCGRVQEPNGLYCTPHKVEFETDTFCTACGRPIVLRWQRI